MSEQAPETSSIRLAVVEALKLGAPGALNDEARRAYLAGGPTIVLAELDMDSLGEMEFCISIELSTGVTLLPSELAELGSTEAIERRIREKLAAADGSGKGTHR